MKFARPLPLFFLLAGAAGSSLFLGCFGQSDVANKSVVAVQLTAAGEEKGKEPDQDPKVDEPQTEAKEGAEPKAEPAEEKPAPQEDETEKPAAKEDQKGDGKGKKPIRKANPFQRRDQERLLDFPDFPKGLDWLNSKKPLTKKDLKGKIVVLDFWTYCCINCLHILPELKILEKQYPNELVVIGVHSAKFDTEKDTENIRQAMRRYEIEHFVVNDAEHKIWDNLGVSSWPTLVLIGPDGKVLGGHSGEFKAADLSPAIDKAIEYYRGEGLLDEKPFPVDNVYNSTSPLLYPGKILADAAGGRLFISDSNHNRIVIAGLDGKLIEVIGSGAIGREDGSYAKATFDHPQGCALIKETLYVADTENHLLRKVDLKAKTVTTIAGVGQQSKHSWPSLDEAELGGELPKRFVGKPLQTALNSPWDLWIHDQDLYIAMAGSHQIWKMPLSESEIGPYSGNGREDIVDGPLLPSTPHAKGYASFAQPSGLSSDGEWLFVADSEGSSIRAVPFDSTKEVATVVGTADQPYGRLFEFGDVDGAKAKAKFQHCLGVAYVNGKIYVADTYNNKIREVDAKTGAVKTLAGKGRKNPGSSDKEGTFHEPTGLTHAQGKLYVADTNNHLIRTIDLASGKVGTLAITGLTAPSSPKVEKKPAFRGATPVKLEQVRLKPVKNAVKLHVSLTVPAGWKLNAEAPMSYWLDSPQEAGPADRAAFGKRKLDKPAAEFDVSVPVKGTGEDQVAVSLTYYYCEKGDDGVCKTGSVIFTVPLHIADDGSGDPVKLTYEIPE
jgi:thiol-disulfide isomerase/thioredoxin/DNA-binding beta-propeller fold protein YncE